jgi:hypothetical protein
MQPRPDIRDAIEAARAPSRAIPPASLSDSPLLGRQLPTEIVEHPLPNARQAIRPGIQVGLVPKSRLIPYRLRGEQLSVCEVSLRRQRAVARGETRGVRTESSGRQSAGGASRLVRLRPTDNPTTPSDDLTAIQDEDRYGPLAAELLDLCTVTRIGEPGPRPKAPALTGLTSYGCPASSRAFAARPHGWASGAGGLPANFSNEQV